MKIGIEAQRLFREKKHGMDMVTLELIRHLQKIDKDNEYVVFVKPDVDNKVIEASGNLRIVQIPDSQYAIWEQWSLPRAARAEGCDILHCTSNTAPLRTSMPLVTTLHDIIFMEHSALDILRSSGSAYQNYGNLYRKWIVPSVVRNSSCIITVSDYEKKRIDDFFGLGGTDTVVSIHNGVSEHFAPVTDTAVLESVKLKYHLPEQFFFFMGNTHPKKNTIGVLKAFSMFRKQTGSNTRLFMIDFHRATLEKMLADIGDPELMDHIALTGYIDNRDLPAIYSQCELFLYPSLRESFGLPVLEAMASGAPVITSTTSSLPEVAGDAAMLVDPFDPDAIAFAMRTLYGNPLLRGGLVAAGIARARSFSWASMARRVLQQYKEVAARSART